MLADGEKVGQVRQVGDLGGGEIQELQKMVIFKDCTE